MAGRADEADQHALVAGGGPSPGFIQALLASPAAIAIAIALAGLVGWELCTTMLFHGDDHLFLTFARAAPGPLLPFFTDQHGGEFYRPVPMALWWLLARAGGGATWPFALLALILHLTAGLLVGALARSLGRSERTALLASALFFAAPAGVETAVWASASTDLLATVATLASLVLLLRGGLALSLLLAALAYLSKESAFALPLLAAALLWGTGRLRIRPLLAHATVVLVALVARTLVLHGAGGTGDPGAGIPVRLLQILAGLITALVGTALPGLVAWTLGAGSLIWAARAALRRGERLDLVPLLLTGMAALPLLGAGWVVGTRYFYLPAAGLAILVADALQGAPVPAALAVLFLSGAGAAGALARGPELAAYRARLAAATEAVRAERARGHRLVRVRCGIQDLDLALDSRLTADTLVLTDVAVSFAVIPPSLREETAFLLASPPRPPSGAYAFGALRVVGLIDAPDLGQRLPQLRQVDLFRRRDGSVGWTDRADPAPPAGGDDSIGP
jgi:hypothetical protein